MSLAMPAYAPAGYAWNPIPFQVQARNGIVRIFGAIGLYRWVPALAIVTALIVAGIAASTGGVVTSTGLGGELSFPSVNNTTSVSPSVGAGAAGLAAVSGIVALASLILVIVSWVGWRNGLREFESARGSPYSPATAVEPARRFYTGTVVAFLLQIVVAVGIGVYIALLAFQAVATSVAIGVPATASLEGAIRLTVVVSVAASAALTAAMYYCASTSLAAVIRPTASPSEVSTLDRARSLMVGGGLVALSGALVLVDYWLLFVAAIGPILIRLGLQDLRTAYSEWLARHPALPPPPRGPGAVLLAPPPGLPPRYG